ncbi:MAG: molybdenum cofactor carrier protein [Gammaproteobacteria bacterium]|nr:molybdenum cofactor carrier protein [Gammaproteobacteria bacterium]
MQHGNRLPIVGVIGSGRKSNQQLAEEVGRLIASLGAHLLTGGGQGVMSAVSEAFANVENRKGLVIGVLPCRKIDPARPKPGYPNRWIEVAIPTHLPLSGAQGIEPMSRNHINVLASQSIVALPGGSGTSCEAALAVQYKRPIIAYLGARGVIPNLDSTVIRAESIGDVDRFLKENLNS